MPCFDIIRADKVYGGFGAENIASVLQIKKWLTSTHLLKKAVKSIQCQCLEGEERHDEYDNAHGVHGVPPRSNTFCEWFHSAKEVEVMDVYFSEHFLFCRVFGMGQTSCDNVYRKSDCQDERCHANKC